MEFNSIKDVKEEILAEYNSLRKEISNTHNHQQSMFIFTLSAVGAIASFALQRNEPDIFLVAYFVLFPTSAFFHNYSRRIMRLSTYIKVFIESEIEGINWEFRANEWRQKGTYLRLDVKNYVFTIAAVLLCALYIGQFGNIKFDWFLLGRMLVPFLLVWEIILLDFKNSNKKSNEIYLEYEKFWKDIKENQQVSCKRNNNLIPTILSQAPETD